MRKRCFIAMMTLTVIGVIPLILETLFSTQQFNVFNRLHGLDKRALAGTADCASLHQPRHGRCTSRPGITNNGSASKTTSTSQPPIIHKIKQTAGRMGRSATAPMVVDCNKPCTDSSSRICEINDPVDFDRTLFFSRGRDQTRDPEIPRRSAPFADHIERCARTMRIQNQTGRLIIIPWRTATHSVGGGIAPEQPS